MSLPAPQPAIALDGLARAAPDGRPVAPAGRTWAEGGSHAASRGPVVGRMAGNGRRRVAFVHLGRSPAFGTFVTSLARSVGRLGSVTADMIVAEGTGTSRELLAAGASVLAVPTFRRATPAGIALGYLRSSHTILEFLAARRPDAVVTLMPHVWSPLLAPRIRRLGIPYATIIHDADPHLGDPTAWVTGWLARDASHADVAVTLSRAVADRLAARRLVAPSRVLALFHPDIAVEPADRAGLAPGAARTLRPAAPLRILFFGRIMPYKGLELLVDAVMRLRQGGFAVELGVAGEGNISTVSAALDRLGAEVINRWLAPAELPALLARYDAVACAHVEASQSGVAALAFGHGLPVVATPVGGVREQVVDGRTGVVADRPTPPAFAAAIARLMREPGLYDHIAREIVASAPGRSMEAFADRLLAALPVQGQQRLAA